MVVRNLGHILCCVCGDKQWNWKIALSQVEFSYNNMVNQSIGKVPFEIAYTYLPRHVYDLAVVQTIAGDNKGTDNMAEKILQIYAEV